MANIIPFNERFKAAVRVLRGRTFPRRPIASYGEQKKMPLLWPDFRTGIAQWHVIDLANYIQEGFSGNSLIYSAIMYKARAQMQVPLVAYKGDPNAPERLPPNDPLAELCARPNFHQSYPEMAMQAKVYFNLAGECFFVYDRPLRGGLPHNIFCLRPDRMHIVPAKNKRKLLGYVYTPENVPVSAGLGILPQDVMHVKLPNPGDPLEGMGHGLSPIAPMAKSADVDNDITDFLKLFFERGVMMPGILSIDAPLDDATLARIRERWKEQYGGHQAWAEEIAVLDVNTKYQRIGLSFNEMGFDSLDERNEGRLLGPFGVPPELIATRLGTKASTYANKELARKQCWEDTLIPELTLFEREWQYYLQGDNGGWVAYDMSDVVALQEDKVALISAAHQLWTMGTPANLAVAEVGLTMEPIPGGDIGYLPMGMLPTIGTASAALPAPASTPVPDAEDEDRQDTTKKGSSPSATSGGRSRLTEQVKQALAKKADVIAWKWTPAFIRTGREQFEIDHRELSAAITAAGKKSIQEKATINWQWLQREWMEIFALAGERWREAFLPGIEGVMIDQGESLNLEFGVQWNVRNLFAEDWFTDYMGDFSKGIVDTTREEMNALLAQGMREGWSIPTTQKHLTQIFETWRGKVPKPGATWDWLEQRIPPNRTEMIARTETIRASARGSQGVYKGWGLNAKEWLTTDDDRLCIKQFTEITIRGGNKAICDVRLGDYAMTADGWRRVIGLMCREYAGRFVCLLSDGEWLIETTIGHLVWEPLETRWKPIEQFVIADAIQNVDGKWRTIDEIITSYDTTTVYNLTIEDSHNFYADGTLVHNCDWCRAMDKKIIGIDEAYFEKGSTLTVPSAATGNPVTMKLNYEAVQGPPLHVSCRCALMPVLPEEGIEPEAGPEEVLVENPIQQAMIAGDGNYEERGGTYKYMSLNAKSYNGITPNDFDVDAEYDRINRALILYRRILNEYPDLIAALDIDGEAMVHFKDIPMSTNIVFTRSDNVGAGSGGRGGAKVFYLPYETDRAMVDSYTQNFFGTDGLYVLMHELHHGFDSGSELDILSDMMGIAAHFEEGNELNPTMINRKVTSMIGWASKRASGEWASDIKDNRTALGWLYDRYPDQVRGAIADFGWSNPDAVEGRLKRWAKTS